VTPAVIDTDPGIDDALALLLAWNSPEMRVEALTTVAGNVPVDLATVNALRLLALRRPSPTPLVAVGAGSPLARPLTTAPADASRHRTTIAYTRRPSRWPLDR